MKVIVVAPDGEEIALNCDVPITLDSLKTALRNQIHGKSLMKYSFYFEKSIISRQKQIHPNNQNSSLNSNENQITISYISKEQYPQKCFPQTDYSFSLDIPLFRRKDSESTSGSFFPPIEAPMCIRNGNPNLTNLVEDTIEQAASYPNMFFGLDPTFENIADAIVNDNFDISQIRNLAQGMEEESNQPSTEIIQHRTRFGHIINVEQGYTVENGEIVQIPNYPSLRDKSKKKKKRYNRRHLFETNSHPEEEEKDNDDAFEEYDGEEEEFAEGIDEIMEMKENYEESMTPEIEQSVERLMKLGFDRNLVTPLLFMLGDEEKTMQFLQKPYNDMMK